MLPVISSTVTFHLLQLPLTCCNCNFTIVTRFTYCVYLPQLDLPNTCCCLSPFYLPLTFCIYLSPTSSICSSPRRNNALYFLFFTFFQKNPQDYSFVFWFHFHFHFHFI